MAANDALDAYSLVPRLLHGVREVDSRIELLGRVLPSPILPLAAKADSTRPLALVPAADLLEQRGTRADGSVVAVLANDKMGELMPRVRELVDLDVPALALDLRTLSDTPPFGGAAWRPRNREDLAELRAAAGRPVWLIGVGGPEDAEVAVEAGLEGIVLHESAGKHLAGPAPIEVLPEVLDAVAGMTGVYIGGRLRSGIDVFRYLAVGAEAVVIETDRAISAFEAELHYAMRLTGCETLADIGYHAIYAPLFHDV